MNNLAGQTIKGYDLQERIGAGGFGAVYRAVQSTVGREVAVKIILPGLANKPDFIRRFESEAHLIARLEHPYIVPLYDYWRDPDGAYLVMRWLRGGSLHEMLKKQGAFSVEETVTMMEQITQALHTAHRSQVIHRDIKPANILLDDDGNAYLADFGIAKDHALTQGVTEADAVVGSPDYLSPEQARSEPVTPQTDIYSLGVVLYEMLTGEHPFPKLSPIEQLFKHLNTPLPDISALDESVRDGINLVIQKATAKNPQERYKDVLEFTQALRSAARVGTGEITTSVVELLTPREQEVLQLMINGKSNREIADALFVEVATIKWYNRQIYRKLNVRSRVQAVVKARELELVFGKPNSATVTTGHLPEPENPYKGLRAFQAADAQDFFGREKLTQKLLSRLQEDVQFKRFLAIVGPSGSGKSSVVRAGLIPALWRGELKGSDKWYIVDMLPGDRPLDELEVALLRIAGDHALNVRDQLERDTHGLIRAANLILPDDGSELLLVIDQFEEVFTLLENEADRQHFLNLLLEAVTKERSRVRVVVTLRADYYDRPLQYPDFGELMRSRVETVLPLGASELERAVREPALMEGVQFEDGLVSRIVADVNYQPGALPLLQYALTELFERRKGRTLTQAAYLELGGTGGALAKRADELYLERDEAGREQIRQLFLRLVTLGEGAEDTRRRALRSELLAITANGDVMDDIIDTYVASRLLSLDHDPATRTPTVEVAHEAILREWDRLCAWLNESREDIRQQRIVAQAADAWKANKRDASYLLRGTRLEQVEKWIQSTELALTPLELDFIATSITERLSHQQAESERQARETGLEQRSRNFLRGLVAIFALATLIATCLSIFAFDQSKLAQASAAEAQNIALTAGSQAALANGNTEGAIALALQAVTLDPTSARAQVILSEAAYMPGTIRTFEGHTNEVDSLALSPDGQTMLSASHDNSVILWNIQTGAIIRRFEGHTSAATSVAFLPDGRTAISASEDKTMIQWNLQTGEIIRQFEGQPDQIWALAITPDGLYAVSGGADGIIILWNIQSGEMIRRFEGGIFGVQSLEFNSDGSRFLSAAFGASVTLWDVETGEIIRHFEGHDGIAYTAIFSPDSQTILSTATDGTMILWDIETGQIINRFYEQNAYAITDAAFSPDGRTIVSGGNGGLVIWNMQTAQPISRLRGHRGLINAIVLSPDGLSVFTASADGTLRLWGLEAGQLLKHLTGADIGGWITALAASPNGQTALAAWSPPTFPDPPALVIRWDVQTGEEIYRADIEEYVVGSVGGWVNNIAISPDGQMALLAIDNRELPSDVVMLDVATGEVLGRFTGHATGVRSVAFSPDGRTAASAGHQGILILWDVATGEEIRRFRDYEGDDPFGNDWEYVGFSPDGQMLITSHLNAMIILWDVATGEEIRHFEGHQGASPNIVFSADGQQMFSGSSDKTAILWDVAAGSIMHHFSDHSASITHVDMTADGRLGLAGSDDNTVTLWDLQTGELIRRYNGVALKIPLFGSDNRTVLASMWPNQIELWRIDATLDELLTWTRANRYVPELTCEQRQLYRVEPLCENE